MNTVAEKDTPLHTATVSGLWGHSHDAEYDLMKHYRVDKNLYKADGTPRGFLGMRSFDTREEANAYQYSMYLEGELYSVYDNFADERLW